MSGVTLFVDESGRFEPGRGHWPWGMRLVGGPAVPETAEAAEALCRRLLDQALAGAGISWWSGEVSGKISKHAPDLAELIQNMPQAPGDVRRLADGVRAGDGAAVRRLQDRGYIGSTRSGTTLGRL